MLNRKIYFLSFADKRYKSINRIRKEAADSNFFDVIKCGDESMFDSWYYEKYKDRFSDRGFGYWQWKSYIINRLMLQINENDILIYADAGCVINKAGEQRFHEYIKMLDDSSHGILLFNIGMKESDWTKGDIFDFFNCRMLKSVTEKGQVAGGILLFKKSVISSQLINEWMYVCHEHYNLLNDTPSVSQNLDGFIENRHDESIISVLCTKYEHIELEGREIYNPDENWDLMLQYPFWAARVREPKVGLKNKIKKILAKFVSFL